MKNRKFYIVLALLFVTALLLFVGVACNTEEPPGGTESPSATASPNAGNTTAGQETPEATPEVTPGEDNEATFPPEWGDWSPTEPAGETTTAPTTETSTATQGVVTQTPARSPTAGQDNLGTLSPTKTPVITATNPTATQDRDNLATLPPEETTNTTATATASPKPSATPIGVDAEGWVDKWY